MTIPQEHEFSSWKCALLQKLLLHTSNKQLLSQFLGRASWEQEHHRKDSAARLEKDKSWFYFKNETVHDHCLASNAWRWAESCLSTEHFIAHGLVSMNWIFPFHTAQCSTQPYPDLQQCYWNKPSSYPVKKQEVTNILLEVQHSLCLHSTMHALALLRSLGRCLVIFLYRAGPKLSTYRGRSSCLCLLGAEYRYVPLHTWFAKSWGSNPRLVHAKQIPYSLRGSMCISSFPAEWLSQIHKSNHWSYVWVCLSSPFFQFSLKFKILKIQTRCFFSGLVNQNFICIAWFWDMMDTKPWSLNSVCANAIRFTSNLSVVDEEGEY